MTVSKRNEIILFRAQSINRLSSTFFGFGLFAPIIASFARSEHIGRFVMLSIICLIASIGTHWIALKTLDHLEE